MTNTASKTTRKTLAELNADPYHSERDGRPTVTTFAVGKVGRMQTGTKTHLLIVDTYTDNGQPRGAAAPCNGRGQFVGRPVKGWDTDKINCSHCLERIAVQRAA